MQRTIGRILAVQALYAFDAGGDKEGLTQFSWLDDEGDKGDYIPLSNKDKKIYDSLTEPETNGIKARAKLLFLGTVESLEKIDDIIKCHLGKGWSLERLNRVALAILRLAIYEISFLKEVDTPIAINEAVEIAKAYISDPKLSKFVNALLDRVGKGKEA